MRSAIESLRKSVLNSQTEPPVEQWARQALGVVAGVDRRLPERGSCARVDWLPVGVGRGLRLGVCIAARGELREEGILDRA